MHCCVAAWRLSDHYVRAHATPCAVRSAPSFIAEFDEAKLDDALDAEGWHRKGKAILDNQQVPAPLQDVRRGLNRQLAKTRGKPDARPWQKVETKEHGAKPADVQWM